MIERGAPKVLAQSGVRGDGAGHLARVPTDAAIAATVAGRSIAYVKLLPTNAREPLGRRLEAAPMHPWSDRAVASMVSASG